MKSLWPPARARNPWANASWTAPKWATTHAIIPTDTDPAGKSLSRDEQRLYDLVCRRLLSAWHGPFVTSITHVVTRLPADEREPDRFHSQGTMVVEPGWKVLDLGGVDKKKARKGNEPPTLPPGLVEGQDAEPLKAEALKKQTRPPKRFTEATLLTAMETAGRTLDDEELAEAMKDSGLGTPATRAEIIETLLRREYLERQKKILVPTEKGIHLIDRVHPQVKSPALTGEWEAKLAGIQRGNGDLASFMQDIETYVTKVVKETLGRAVDRAEDERPAAAPSTADSSLPDSPTRVETSAEHGSVAEDQEPWMDQPPPWVDDRPPDWLEREPPPMEPELAGGPDFPQPEPQPGPQRSGPATAPSLGAPGMDWARSGPTGSL